ncbi:MAG: iron dicitrate transport regulator FecR [Planctomycetaceae bacterium]|nr:iron dicitrate transport regulator FecR [Planctomycetaceae bacterium]
MDTDQRITAVLALRGAQRVVVFTGAGVSAESGIPTFRDAGGFWQLFPPETFATWNGLLRTAVLRPRLLAEFVLNVVEPVAAAVPNAAHRAIAQLAQNVPTTVVTQNIDGLHQAAGSTSVLEIHGSLLEVVDVSTGRLVHQFGRDELQSISRTLREYVAGERSLASSALLLRRQFPLDWRGRHRPNLVLFGDALAEPAWTHAGRAVDACDTLISVGTSGAVYPAALLPSRAEAHGATVITVDPQPAAGCWLEGPAGDVLPRLIADAFESRASPPVPEC